MGGIKAVKGGPRGDPETISTKRLLDATLGVENKDASTIGPTGRPAIPADVQTVASANDLNSAVMFASDPNYPKNAVLSMEVGRLGALRGAEKTPDGEPITCGPANPLTSARLTLHQGTDNTGIVSTRGNYNFCPAAELSADTVKIGAKKILELGSGGAKYDGHGAKINSGAGAVHIVAGNKTSGGSYDLQKMVKGDNLKAALEEMMKKINQVVEVQRAIQSDLTDLKQAMGKHMHNVVAPGGFTGPSADLCLALGIAAPGAVINTCNNAGASNNNEYWKINHLKPTSKKYILSRWNKVN